MRKKRRVAGERRRLARRRGEGGETSCWRRSNDEELGALFWVGNCGIELAGSQTFRKTGDPDGKGGGEEKVGDKVEGKPGRKEDECPFKPKIR